MVNRSLMDENLTKSRILDTAAHLFGEYGKTAVSTTRIAKEAGVNKAMIFYYFGSKDELYLSAVRKLTGELFSLMNERLSLVEPGLPVIEAFVRTHVGYLIEHPALVKLLVRELLVGNIGDQSAVTGLVSNLEGIRTRFVESLKIAMERGEIRRVDPIHTILNIISMDVFVFVGKPLINVMFKEPDMDRIVNERADHILDLLMNGLRQKPE
jgi:TetR/AcrR family transcriptional regulator